MTIHCAQNHGALVACRRRTAWRADWSAASGVTPAATRV